MKKKRPSGDRHRCLLLNATYEPITLVSTKRAIVLVLTNKAEILHEDTLVWRSASREVSVPTVIRLRYYVKVPFRVKTPLTRRAVLTRDNHVCQYCGAHATTIDHVVPRSKGGPHTWENLVACCMPCNARKDDRLLEQLGWKLARKPQAPIGTMWLVVGVKARDEWAPYLSPATV